MTVRLVARPIDTWPGPLTPEADRQVAKFTAQWGDTVDLLEREVRALAPRGEVDTILQLAITERDCRNDGWIRADARPTHPGVILTFESRHGPLRYSTDRFSRATYWQGGGRGYVTIPGWQCNVRAIALGLEALRKVDRYGLGQGGEQYRGWQALPPGTPMPAAAMTIDQAARLLVDLGEVDGAPAGDPTDLIEDHPLRTETIAGYYRLASKRHHPDAGGDPETFRRLTEARDLLAGGAR